MLRQSDLFQDEFEGYNEDELQPILLAHHADPLPTYTYADTARTAAVQPTTIHSISNHKDHPSPFTASASCVIIPREVQLLRLENVAIPACYLVVGIVQGLSGALMNVYPLDLGATEAAQVTLSVIVQIPSTIKIVYGFLSDSVPLGGARRKPYMWIGWFLVMLTMMTLFMTTDLSMDYNDQDGRHLPIPPGEAPSIEFLSALFFVLGLGLWLADVMGDSLVVEKARLEPDAIKGHMQSSCYACRFFGMMVAAPLSTFLYTRFGPKSVVVALGMSPMIVIPLIVCLREDKVFHLKSAKERLRDIWVTVKSRAVWQPLAFVYVYNLLQVPNGAWRQFLKSVLWFTETQINYLLVISYILLYLGTLLYKHFFLRSSWRRVYQGCILLNGVFSGLQLLLIRGQTFGLSPFLFALGDEAFAELVKGVQFLPATIMLVHLCPEGSEGAAYAMFTTFSNSAILLAPAISTPLLGIWDVSKETLEAGDLNGFFNLTVLTTILQLSPILVLRWLPNSSQELHELSSRSHSSSALGGFAFLFIAFASLVYILGVGILNIVSPGWSGESR